MNRKEIMDAAIERGWTCNCETGEIWSHTGKLITGKSNGYIQCSVCTNKTQYWFQGHKFIWYVSTGETGEEIDHLNGDKSDNRFINLQSGSKSQNQHNRKPTKGYCWDKTLKKWRAQITIDYKQKHLGLFDTEEEAKQVYLEAKKIYHPTKAYLFTK